MAFQSVIEALKPVKVVVWGEQAMAALGVSTIVNSYMLIPSESEFDLAAQKLVQAGFRPAPWSFGIIDPQHLPDVESSRCIDPCDMPGFRVLDENSLRFQFPVGGPSVERVVLLRSTFVGLSPPNDPLSMQKFVCQENAYYPDASLLLESFIKTFLKDCSQGFPVWKSELRVWAISYVYCQLMVEDDVLDSCGDESVKAWFNENIRRGKGGLNRTTVSKRVGKHQA